MTVSIEQAQLQLAQLIERSRKGEKIVITDDRSHAVELRPVELPLKQKSGFGCLKGKIRFIEDATDNSHLDDFKEYM